MRKSIILAAFIALSPGAAFADLIEVHSDTAYTGGGGEGGGRAQGFEALSDFSISSVGIEANLISQLFDVVIYNSTTGQDVGAVAATFSAVLGGSGFGWYDMAVNFAFAANQFYVVNWRPNSPGDWVTQLGGGPGNPGIQYYHDSDLPVIDGPFRLVEGFEGFNAQSQGNFLHPSMRYNVVEVPEPTTLLLLGLGLACIGFSRRRKMT